MRRSLVRWLAVLVLVFATVMPASAVPRQDDGILAPASQFERFIEIVKHVITTLDDVRATVPIP